MAGFFMGEGINCRHQDVSNLITNALLSCSQFIKNNDIDHKIKRSFLNNVQYYLERAPKNDSTTKDNSTSNCEILDSIGEVQKLISHYRSKLTIENLKPLAT